MKIPFNKPCFVGPELKYIEKAIASGNLSGSGEYSNRCQSWFENKIGCSKALMVPSCTAAMELAALLVGIEPGDEVIMPSFTFSSTANAFQLRGATIVFVDIDRTTLNIDANLIEAAVTPKTKAIVPVQYAGVSCEMDQIMVIADRHDLFVIEDAAQALGASWRGQPVGSKGHFSAFSFHETKNVTSGGEGGMLCINAEKFSERAEIIREKGTNRSQFFRGIVDKYTWVDTGSSFLTSDIQAAYLFAQLERLDLITADRMQTWDAYFTGLEPLQQSGELKLPSPPAHCEHNAHIFHLRTNTSALRDELLATLNKAGMRAVFHYIPLHSSPQGKRVGRFHGEDKYTTEESSCLIRLPLYYGLEAENVQKIIRNIVDFYADFKRT